MSDTELNQRDINALLIDTAADDFIVPARVRGYIYRLLCAGAPIVTAYGILDASKVALWLAFGATFLGFGMASLNTPTKATSDAPPV